MVFSLVYLEIHPAVTAIDILIEIRGDHGVIQTGVKIDHITLDTCLDLNFGQLFCPKRFCFLSYLGKCFVADLIFTISRTIDDRQNGTGRFFIAKNRFGEDGVILPAKIDLARAKMEVFPPNGETIGEVQALTAKKQSENLKERYKAFREGSKK